MDIQHKDIDRVEARPIRVAESRKKKRKRRSWSQNDAIGIAAAICALLATAFFIWYFSSEVGSVVIVPGTLFLTASLILGALYTRNRYRNNMSRWESAGCPQCGNLMIKRMRRKRRHRVVGVVTNTPIRRYICPECSWRGTRIDESRLH